MEYFVGIVPPQEYQQQIVAFQKRWSTNHLPEVVEPHITVKAQGGLTEDMAWFYRMKEVCSLFPCFQLSLSEPTSFGSCVLYLGVSVNGIMDLHKRLVKAVSPSSDLIKRYFEWELYTPHLTLGQTQWGMNASELEEMKTEARIALAPFPTFTVSHIRIYKEIEPNRYEAYEDIQLA